MTAREQNITKAVLDHLHTLDHGTAIDLQIHAAINNDPAICTPLPGANELDAVLRHCNTEKWVNAIPARFGGKMKYAITDDGEAARLEM